MKELLQILAVMFAIVVVVCMYFKVTLFVDDWCERKLGISFRRRRTPKLEIQTLFHGNTKDQDQI